MFASVVVEVVVEVVVVVVVVAVAVAVVVVGPRCISEFANAAFCFDPVAQ